MSDYNDTTDEDLDAQLAREYAELEADDQNQREDRIAEIREHIGGMSPRHVRLIHKLMRACVQHGDAPVEEDADGYLNVSFISVTSVVTPGGLDGDLFQERLSDVATQVMMQLVEESIERDSGAVDATVYHESAEVATSIDGAKEARKQANKKLN